VWHRDPDILAARAASVKDAFISMGGAVIHHATIPDNPCLGNTLGKPALALLENSFAKERRVLSH
jgi:hypothetical protein